MRRRKGIIITATKGDEELVFTSRIAFLKHFNLIYPDRVEAVLSDGELDGYTLKTAPKKHSLTMGELDAFIQGHPNLTGEALIEAVQEHFKVDRTRAKKTLYNLNHWRKKQTKPAPVKPGRKHSDTDHLENYKALLGAVAEQALKDYRQALRTLKRYPGLNKARATVLECERYFKSNLYDLIGPMPGHELIETIRRQEDAL